MGCKNCTKKFHPISVLLAIIAWIMIFVGVVFFIKWIFSLSWIAIFWLGVVGLCIAFGYSAAEADDWYNSYKGY